MTFRVTFATVTQHSLYFLLRFSSTGTKERHWTGNHPDKDNFRQKRVVWKVCILSFQFAQFIQQVRFKVLLNRRWIYVKEIRLRRNSILRIIYLKGKTLQGDGDSKKKKYFDSKTHFFNSKELKWTKLFGAAERRLKILSSIRDRASGVRDTSAVRQNIFSALVQN